MEIVTTSTTTRDAPRKRARRTKKKKPNATQQVVRVKNVQRNQRVERPTFRLSECSSAYLKAIAMPFNKYNVLPCIPDLIDRPSAKYRIEQRGTCYAGTAGFGFVAADVNRFFQKDITSVLSTLAAFSGTTIVDTGGTTTQLSYSTQAPYTDAEIGAGAGYVSYRPVAFGLRARYIGTELNRSGRVIPYRPPGNQPLNTFDTPHILSDSRVISRPTTRSWSTVTWQPVAYNDYDYQNGNYPALPQGYDVVVIVIDGAATGAAFEWEAVGYYEACGSVVNTTPSHSDTPGLSSVRDFLEKADAEGKPSETIWNEAVKYFRNLTPNDVSGWVNSAKVAKNLLEL